MEGFLHFAEIVGICITVLAAIAAMLFLVAKHLPAASPLKETLKGLGRRFGATALVTLVGLPLQPIPEVDGIYDIGALIMLAIYWYGMMGNIKSAKTTQEARGHALRAAPKIIQLLRIIKRSGRR